MSNLQATLAWQMKAAGIIFVEEFEAIPGRKLRFDFAVPSASLLIEVQGGTFAKDRSGHSTGMGINRDCAKTVIAQLAGWKVFPVDTKQIHSGLALMWIQEALKAVA